MFCDNVVRSNCVSHVLISSYIYRFVLMERSDNQNESTIIKTSACDVADASRRVARASRMTEHPYGQGECASTQASRQLRPLPSTSRSEMAATDWRSCPSRTQPTSSVFDEATLQAGIPFYCSPLDRRDLRSVVLLLSSVSVFIADLIPCPGIIDCLRPRMPK